MKAKVYLQRIRLTQELLDRTRQQIEALTESMTSVGSLRYDKVRVQTSSDGDKMTDYIQRLGELTERARLLECQYYEYLNEATERLYSFEPELWRGILISRYIFGRNFDQIARTMGYSRDYIARQHSKALQAFGKCYLNEE